jgi:type I restriction enzyme S subunit
VKQFANGANVLHLLPERIAEFVTAVPPTVLQVRYAEIVRALHSYGDVLLKVNDNLRKTRDLLLPKLISGELDVSRLVEAPVEAVV